MKRVLPTTAMLTIVGVASAQTTTTSADAFDAGKGFANTGKGVVGGRTSGVTGSNVLPYYSITVPETTNFQEGRNLIGGADTNKQTQYETHKAPNASQQQKCDAVNFISKDPTQRPKSTIDERTGPILTGSKGAANNPGGIPGASTRQCRVERAENLAVYITETCTETQTLEDLSCKRMLKVAHNPERGGCDQDGIVPNSWTGDMATNFTPDEAGNYVLQFGTIADSYWSGWGAVYDRNLTFDIRDAGLIARSALIRAAFDDWLTVKVDSDFICVGPRGGDRLEIYSPPPVFESSSTRSCIQTWDDWGSGWQCPDMGGGSWWGGGSGDNAVPYQSCTAVGDSWSCTTSDYRTGMVQYYATCFNGPEFSMNQGFGSGIDMRPYLKNGPNTIFMRTIVVSGGEGMTQPMTRQLCPRNYYDQQDNSQCAPLEQRAQRW